MKRKALLLLLSALLLAAPLATKPRQPEGSADPRPDILREDAWFALMMKGSHVGWLHMLRRPATLEEGEEGKAIPAVISEQVMEMRVRRYGDELWVRSRQRSVEHRGTAEPLRITSHTEMSGQVSSTRGVFQGGKLRLTVETAGVARDVELDWPAGGLLEYGGDLLLIKETNLEPGKEVTFPTFSADLGSVVETTVRVEGVRPDGLVSLRASQRELPGQSVRILVKKPGWKVQEMEVSVLGIRMVRTSREEARNLSTDLPDLGFSTMVRVAWHGEDPRGVDRAVYRLRASEEVLATLDLGDGGRQRVLGVSEDGLRLEVQRTGFPREEGSGPPPPPETLEASSLLQTDAPALEEAWTEASQACPQEKAAERAACLSIWVRDQVDEQALDVGFATAAEVARDRRGDCSEHAVFLAALLRMAGIPSRVRSGLMYLPSGEGGVFGYHLWTQAWLGGWVDLDATLDGREADALHIGLATGTLADPAGITPLAAMAPVMGNLEIEVLEAE